MNKPTFGSVADDYVSTELGHLKNEKHREQWATTLGCKPFDMDRVRISKLAHSQYLAALEAIRAKAFDTITTADVQGVVRPIWTEQNETASRVLGRIERVLSYAATLHGAPNFTNPATFKGNLEHVLPKVRVQTEHHAALPYSDAPAFMSRLLAVRAPSVSLTALMWTVLTACRSGETLGATWAEISEDGLTWTIPAARTKAAKEHRVPLSTQAQMILDQMRRFRRTQRGDLTQPSREYAYV
ncbi:tyrosine-type recombinase/integrase [Oryzibacter oryziterrae]|uniref:tyrosine-type recombinase/integrase n=1 Tax=Oryzibacter oryziterrae TaxID=2766474 RepID=UPI001F35DF4F|nr:site-specific integrase [Oryzibacter oryziterrae]